MTETLPASPSSILKQRTPEWLAARRLGIGGSDAPVILGLSPWRTPYELWEEKTSPPGAVIAPEVNEAMIWGTALEAAVMGEYKRRAGRDVIEVGLMRHPAHAWMIGSPDGLGADDGRIIEIKTTRSGQGWGEQGTDEIPLHYLTQVHHYLIVSGAPIADVAVLIAGSEFRIYHVEPDAALHADLVEQEAEFWRLVEAHTPPATKTFADAVRRWGRVNHPGAIVADRDLVEAVERLRDIQETVKTFDATADELKAKIVAALGDAGDTLTDDSGHILATWKLDKGRAGYTVASKEPSRRFLVKG